MSEEVEDIPIMSDMDSAILTAFVGQVISFVHTFDQQMSDVLFHPSSHNSTDVLFHPSSHNHNRNAVNVV